MPRFAAGIAAALYLQDWNQVTRQLAENVDADHETDTANPRRPRRCRGSSLGQGVYRKSTPASQSSLTSRTFALIVCPLQNTS